MSEPLQAIVFLDWGRWVADCPNPACTNAREVRPGMTTFSCDLPPSGCGTASAVVWPADLSGALAEVAGLPPAQQHWRPEDAA